VFIDPRYYDHAPGNPRRVRVRLRTFPVMLEARQDRISDRRQYSWQRIEVPESATRSPTPRVTRCTVDVPWARCVVVLMAATSANATVAFPIAVANREAPPTDPVVTLLRRGPESESRARPRATRERGQITLVSRRERPSRYEGRSGRRGVAVGLTQVTP
jgi:hypothetical protein